jgi:hypothetical protein
MFRLFASLFKCKRVKMRYTDITPKLIPRPFTRKLFFVLLVLVGLVSGLLSAATANAADTTSLVVKLVDGLDSAQQAAVIARNGGVEKSAIPALRLHVISVPTIDLQLVQQSYNNDPQVKSVELNKTRKVEGMSNDQSYSAQWALSSFCRRHLE